MTRLPSLVRGVLMGSLLLVPSVGFGALAPASSAGTGKEGAPVNVPKIRTQMDTDMAQIGLLLEKALRDGDMPRGSCVEDKRVRGQVVLSLAKGEMLVLSDSGATPATKGLAGEKLSEAGKKMSGLAAAAEGCSGDLAPDDVDDLTKTLLDFLRYLPWLNPTATPTSSPVPPSIDDTVPPVVCSPCQ
jgi:hypothetical protein